MRCAVVAVLVALVALCASSSEYPNEEKDKITQPSTGLKRKKNVKKTKRKGGSCNSTSDHPVRKAPPVSHLEELVALLNWDMLVSELERLRPERVPPVVLSRILDAAPWALVPRMLNSIPGVVEQLEDIGLSPIFGPLAVVLEHCPPDQVNPALRDHVRACAARWAAARPATNLHAGLSVFARDIEERFVSALGEECPLYREVASHLGYYMQRHAVPSFAGRCPVCLEDYSEPYLYATACGHALCPACAHKALRVRPKCPLCAALAFDQQTVFESVHVPGYVPQNAVIEDSCTPEQLAGAHPRAEESHEQSMAQAQAVLSGLQVPVPHTHGGDENADDSDDGSGHSSVSDPEADLQTQQALFYSLFDT